MRRNLSSFEQAIRLASGLIILLVLFSRGESGWVEWSLGIAAVFLILNGLTARCYLWRVLGINTLGPEQCERERRLGDS